MNYHESSTKSGEISKNIQKKLGDQSTSLTLKTMHGAHCELQCTTISARCNLTSGFGALVLAPNRLPKALVERIFWQKSWHCSKFQRASNVNKNQLLLSLKLTNPPWKSMLAKWTLLTKGLFSGAFAGSFREGTNSTQPNSTPRPVPPWVGWGAVIPRGKKIVHWESPGDHSVDGSEIRR